MWAYPIIMELNKEQLIEVINCVKFYQQRHISINNGRYAEYETILELLNKSLIDTHK